MIRWFAALWRGELPLVRAFWDGAILYGVPLNLVSTFGFLALSSQDNAALGLIVNVAPLPYNVAVLVGVWRSAARYEGPAHWAESARVAVAIWFLIELFA